jgi:hypothetical protein
MKTYRLLLLCAITVVLSFALEMAIQKNRGSITSKTVYLKTAEPMLLGAEGQIQDFHVLPVGAALYKFKEFPEGHTTYLAYINIKGPFAAERIESKEANIIDPMWAMSVRPEEVAGLVQNTPISKEDLTRILKARQVTRADLAQLVRDWKD